MATKLVKRFLPSGLLAGLRTTVRLRSIPNSPYRRIESVINALRRARRRPVLRANIKRVLFLCHGNIMRSPVAEAMLRQELQRRGRTDITVCSAGLHASVGRSSDPRALSIAPEFGVSVVPHRAQPLTGALVDSADLLVVMDTENAAEFLLLYPRASEKLFFLRQFSQHSDKGHEIPDPYPGDEQEMRLCCHILRECVEGLTAKLLAEPLTKRH